MGKKKAGGPTQVVDNKDKVFCYWCDKDFEDERVLIQHQTTKHFRCPLCPTRQQAGNCNTLHGLVIHYRKAHTAGLMVVPNAKPGRDDPATSMNIVGMRYVPEEIVAEWRNDATPPPVFVSSAAQIPQQQPVAASGFLGDMGNLAGAGAAGMEMMMGALPSLQAAAAPPVAPAAPTPGEGDMAAQVAAWMAMKALEPKEPEPPPPLPQRQRSPSPVRAPAAQPLPETYAEPSKPRPVDPAPSMSSPVEQFGFQLPQAKPAQPSYSKAQVQDAAASFLAGALGNLESSRLASSAAASRPANAAQSPAHATRIQPLQATAPAAAVAPTETTASADKQGRKSSRSRGRHSRSPRKRSRSIDKRPAAFDSTAKPGTFESRTIQIITTGVVGTRLWLKSEMQRFGRVEVCHTGNRNDPAAEPAWVRFEKMSSVETALKAINEGQVLLEGVPIKAEMKKQRPQQRPQQSERRRSRSARPANNSSRDFRRDDRSRDEKPGRSGPGNYSSRDLAREDQAARQGPGNYSSRDLARQDALKRQQKKLSRSRSRSRSRRRR